MSKLSKAKARAKRKTYAKPSLPRAIGANDNNPAAVNDNGVSPRPGIDDRDKRALSIAKARAAQEATEDARSHYERLINTGVEAHITGTKVTGKRVGGLEWLFRKQRITLNQYRAGEQYGDDFAKAEEPPLRSCLNDRVGGEPEPMQETKKAAAERLAAARWVLMDHEGLVALLDAVCGYGARVRTLANGDDTEAARKEAQLVIALDFLRRHYGII